MHLSNTIYIVCFPFKQSISLKWKLKSDKLSSKKGIALQCCHSEELNHGQFRLYYIIGIKLVSCPLERKSLKKRGKRKTIFFLFDFSTLWPCAVPRRSHYPKKYVSLFGHPGLLIARCLCWVLYGYVTWGSCVMFSKKPIPRAAAGGVLSLVVTNSLRTDFFWFFFFWVKGCGQNGGAQHWIFQGCAQDTTRSWQALTGFFLGHEIWYRVCL